MKHALLIMLAGSVLLTACGPKVAPDAAALNVQYTWSKADLCASTSPEIQVSGVPAGTVQLKIGLSDKQAPSWNHGGGTVPYSGNGTIPAGALTDGYNGPCPPSGSHTYVFRVLALNADNVAIGIGEQQQRCCQF